MAFEIDDRLQLDSFEVDDGACQADLGELSALELIELIEQEEQLVESFEQGRELGANALLHRIMNFAVEQQDADDEQVVAARATQLLDELHETIDQLETTCDQLDQRSARLDQQEIAQADIAAMLLEAQTQLANRIDQAQKYLAGEKRGREQRAFRRAA